LMPVLAAMSLMLVSAKPFSMNSCLAFSMISFSRSLLLCDVFMGGVYFFRLSIKRSRRLTIFTWLTPLSKSRDSRRMSG